MPKDKNVNIHITIRIKPDLHKQIKNQAAADHRSINAQIAFLLEKALNRKF